MSTISLRLPNSLHNRIRKAAKKEGISINQFIVLAATEKLTALDTEEYLAQRAKRASRERFLEAMAQVAAVEPDREEDRIHEVNLPGIEKSAHAWAEMGVLREADAPYHLSGDAQPPEQEKEDA